MGFVGNYAPCGLSPQTDGMPVIHKNRPGAHNTRTAFVNKTILKSARKNAELIEHFDLKMVMEVYTHLDGKKESVQENLNHAITL